MSNAVPMLAGIGLLMVCCSSSSVASMLMGGEETPAAGAGAGSTTPPPPDPNGKVIKGYSRNGLMAMSRHSKKTWVSRGWSS